MKGGPFGLETIKDLRKKVSQSQNNLHKKSFRSRAGLKQRPSTCITGPKWELFNFSRIKKSGSLTQRSEFFLDS